MEHHFLVYFNPVSTFVTPKLVNLLSLNFYYKFDFPRYSFYLSAFCYLRAWLLVVFAPILLFVFDYIFWVSFVYLPSFLAYA